MNFLKIYLFIFILFCFSLTSTSQTFSSSSGNDFWSNLRYGGSLGLGFGGDYFTGSLAPSAIYPFNEYFSTGVGLNLIYVNDDHYKAFVYGGSVLGILAPIQQLQFSVEFEQLRVNRQLKIYDETLEENYWYPALFLGGGYVVRNVTIGVRYDILYKEDKSIYGSAFMPFIRVYF